jgi:hypothetical protein
MLPNHQGKTLVQWPELAPNLGCGRKVTPENVCTFDWAHKDRAKWTIHISQLVYKSEAYFQKQWPLERAKCRLLHSICHKAETTEENKR